MLGRSSVMMNRVGSYFGVENTESSLDMWKEKIERAAKRDVLTISLANMLPSDMNDPDKDIKLLEDILAQPDDVGNEVSTHLMSNSTEEIVSVQVLRSGEDTSAWRQDQESEIDCSTVKKVWIPANESSLELEADGKTPQSSESILQETVEMKTLQDPAIAKKNQEREPAQVAGASPIDIMKQEFASQEKRRRSSVSFYPAVSVVEFEKSKRKLSLKNVLKIGKSKANKKDSTSNVNVTQETRQREVIHQYQTKLGITSSSDSDITNIKDDNTASKEVLIESCSLHRPSGAIYTESDKRIKIDDKNVSDTTTCTAGFKPKGILSHREKWKVEHLDAASGTSSEYSDGDDMLTGSAALDYYDLLCKAREEAIESKRERGLLESLKKKEELLDAVMESAIESRKASNQSGSLFQSLRSLWKKSQYNSIKPHPTLSSQIRIQIEGLPEYKPYMTVIISIAQIITFLLLCFFGGFAPVGLRPITKYLDNVKTFRGTETVTSLQYPNVWVGPRAAYWIRQGALFAPCLRNDYKINVMLSKEGYQMLGPLGCCQVEARNTAGTTIEQHCHDLTYGVGNWRPMECSHRPAGDNNIAHILKPCCYKLTGECKLTTHQHCTFLGGYYHKQGAEHCSQVNCLADICGLGGLTMQADPDAPYMPVQPNQWWRLLISPFYHNGILHLVLVLIPQLLLAIPIERMAGGVRLFLIYFVSEITGYLFASFFTPYLPHMGSSAAVCGLIAVQSIEVAQSWVLVKRPHMFILKLIGILLTFLLSGTLPYLDNFAHIGGFIGGLLAGVIFLPYIVFGQWHSRRRRILLFLAVPSLVLILSMLLLLFYMVQGAEFCSSCHYINCIPYTPSLCNSTWYNPQPSISMS